MSYQTFNNNNICSCGYKCHRNRTFNNYITPNYASKVYLKVDEIPKTHYYYIDHNDYIETIEYITIGKPKLINKHKTEITKYNFSVNIPTKVKKYAVYITNKQARCEKCTCVSCILYEKQKGCCSLI